jgi:D-3-phosphoglycerate dehydrogenase
MGEDGLNIANMQNASREKAAYTILDIESRISDEALDRIKHIDGMLRVRVVQ